MTDFEALAAAYYDHDDMRELFAMLVDDDSDVVDEGWEELEPSLMVDGEVFESTAAAVPRLLDVAAGAHHRRAYALGCVGHLVGGFGEHSSLVRAAVVAYAGRIAAMVSSYAMPLVRQWNMTPSSRFNRSRWAAGWRLLTVTPERYIGYLKELATLGANRSTRQSVRTRQRGRTCDGTSPCRRSRLVGYPKQGQEARVDGGRPPRRGGAQGAAVLCTGRG